MNTSTDAARAWPACTCCGQPCRPEDAPVCFACTLLGDRLCTEYPTFFVHVVEPSSVATLHMNSLRLVYLSLAQALLDLCPPNRSRSLALAELDTSLMRAQQSLALTGELVDPRAPRTLTTEGPGA